MTLFEQIVKATTKWILTSLDRRPGWTAFVVVGTSAAVGGTCFHLLTARHDDPVFVLRDESEKNNKAEGIGWEEARVRAMVENAQKSTWKQNLKIAMDAQERFMLPGRTPPSPSDETAASSSQEYADKIDRRADEILTVSEEKRKKRQEEEHLLQQRQQRFQTSTRIWK